MSKSLRDQLVSSGLAKDTPRSRKKKSPKARKSARASGSASKKDDRPSQIEINALAKAERDRELNAKRQQELARRETVGQIRQLIEGARIELKGGEVDYNFTHGKTVHKLFVTQELHTQLAAGFAAVVSLDGSFGVVPRTVADKIIERDASFVVVLNDGTQTEDVDDEYADYKIPDDLMW